MSMAHVVGIDPGLVHTGLVGLHFDADNRVLRVDHDLVQGLDIARIKGRCMTGWNVYIEQYRPRQHFGTDVRMVQAEADLRRALPSAKFLPNMGIKKVVTQELMEMLELWMWRPVSHHQDLRSAARIALLGMMKDEVLNPVLATVVSETLDGQLWTIQHA